MKKIYVKGPIVSNGEKWIYDWFEEDATCPNDVVKELPEDAGPVTVIINSGGGYVDCGNEIYTELRTYAGKVTTLVIEAASAASVIAMAGDVVQITPPGQIMIHNSSMVSKGDYRAMDKSSEILQKRNRSIASTYRLKTGMSEEELLEMMNQETWLTAQEAKEYGFVDEILFDEDEAIKFVASSQRMLPQNIVEKMQKLKRSEESGELLLENNVKNKKSVNPLMRFLF